MKNVNPFGCNYTIPHHTIGGVSKKKKRKLKNIEDLRYGSSVRDQEFIDLCLNCPYPECRTKCDIIRQYKEDKKNLNKKEL